jgi:transglutaminase-like putative cysteine protease
VYIRIGFEFQFDLTSPTHLLLMLHAHPDCAQRLQRPERLHFDPELRSDLFTDSFGNRSARVMAPSGKVRIWYDNIVRDSGEPEPVIDGLRLHPVDELPNDVLPFLIGSRYCEVHPISPMAWDLFGKTPQSHERVQAVLDWVQNHVRFNYKQTRVNKTAYDTWYEQQGVCRDYQHLAITILRALNIPARYATGYLGDIGVAPDGLPDDFSAWMEVFMGGRWVTLDARHNRPRIGRVLMARGRDAGDVALVTSFGAARLERFKVWTEECGAEAIGQGDGILVSPVAETHAPMPIAA